MTATERTKPNYGRRILWVGVFAALLVAGYSAGWFYLAGLLEARAKATIARVNRDGVTAECENPVARGFPFRLGIYCDRVAYADAVGAVGFSAGGFRSAGQIYDPMRFVAELDGPATLDTPGNGSLKLDWERLRASVRWAEPLPERVSVEGGNAAVSLAAGAPLATIGDFEAHMRPNGEDLDLAGNFEGLVIDPALVDGRKLPSFSGQSDVTIQNGTKLAASRSIELRGQSGTIRTASLSTGPQTGVTVSGPFKIGDDGLVDATLKITIRDPRGLSAVLSEAFPEKRREIGNVFSALTFMGDEPTVPLTIDKGRAMLGFIPLGQIPPVQ